jgi:uncharacterized protein
VTTHYPDDGRVVVRVAETDGRPWTLALRVPGWTASATITGPQGQQNTSPGTITVEWPFAAGDEVILDLPMEPRWTSPDPRIDSVRGCVAVERGPIVYCAESVDLPGGQDVSVLEIDPSSPPRDADGAVNVSALLRRPSDREWPYVADAGPADDATERVDVALHPYHDWATRGPATMRVWLPVSTSERSGS